MKKKRSMDRYSPRFIILCFFLIGCACVNPISPFAQSLVGGDIIFVSRRTPDSGDWSLYKMDSDGNNQQRIVEMPVRSAPPVPSPDGSRVLFTVYNKNHNFELYLLNLSTGDLLLLATGERYIGSAAWAPDGQMIAFTRNRGADTDNKDIFLINDDGSGLRALTSTSDNSCPAWSPDGSQIAYCTGSRIFVMNLDGSDKTPLTDPPLSAGRPHWSPNGSQIAFTGIKAREDGTQIFVMYADGGNIAQLTNTVDPGLWDSGYPRNGNEKAAWSPDGDFIAYVSWEDGDAEIFVMESNGTHKTQLTHADRRDESPAWSPTGEAILFSSRRDMKFDYEIYLMNPDGSNQVAISKYSREDSFPVWLSNL